MSKLHLPNLDTLLAHFPAPWRFVGNASDGGEYAVLDASGETVFYHAGYTGDGDEVCINGVGLQAIVELVNAYFDGTFA